MGNRTTNALVFASILCCFVGRSGRTEERIESEARPNILILYGDDQSYKTLSCYPEAPKWVKTPNLDKLAASGIRFERAYLGAWCMPSRASLLTGRFQHAISSMSMEGTYPGSRYDPDRSPFFPKLFRQQGYETAQIGKWHTGTDTGYGRDWDYQAVWNRPANPDNAGNYYYDQKLTINGKDEMVSEYSTDHYTKLATEYIAGKHRSGQKPWMLWVCYGAIHGPTTPAQRHLGSLRGNEASIPTDVLGPWPDKPKYLEKTSAWVKGPDGKPAVRKRKTGEGNFDLNESGKSLDAWVQQINECNRAIDESVGAILHTLQQTGQLEKTLVIYTADQGYAMGEHGFNQKVAPYDACIASPLIISRPAQVPSNQVCKHPVTAPDLMEFCCHTAGVSIPWKTHGRDIRPLIDNPKAESWSQPLLMTHTARSYGEETVTIPTDDRLTAASNVPWYALLRDGKYKYVRTLVEGETEEVYDLQTDPEELVNLAKKPENRSLLETLRSKAIEQLRRTDAPFVDHLPPTQDEIERAGQAKAIPKENETFLVGTAKVDITPEGPIRMNGFLVRKEESNSVRHPIWAKAMAIGTDSQDPCLLITVDTLGIPASVHREVSKRLLERYGLRTERIAITASHTHTGPMINDCAPNIFGEPIPEESLKTIDRYSKVFVDRLVEVAVKAMETRKPSKLQWGKGKASFAKNRRDKNGPIDHELPMLLVRDLQGALRAIYASYACHCVTLGDRAIGGDWAGFAQIQLERRFPDAIAMISIGCAGDQNPNGEIARSNAELAESQGIEIADEVARWITEPLQPVRGPLIAKLDSIDLPLDVLPSRTQWEETAKLMTPVGYHARVQLAKLDRGESLRTSIPYPIQSFHFGDSLSIVFLAGEVVSEYGLRIKSELDGKRVWVNAYSNASPCYIPSEKVLKAGGYEGAGAMVYYDQPTKFAPGLEQKIIDVVRQQNRADFSPLKTQ